MPAREKTRRPRRAVIVGAGSFGTAMALLVARAGLRTTLQARTPEQAEEIDRDRENREYLAGVALPPELKVEAAGDGLERADLVFLAVPSHSLGEAAQALAGAGLPASASVVTLAKGLVPPLGTTPSEVLGAACGAGRVAVIGGPAHASELVREGGALVAASRNPELAATLASIFNRGGVICELSDDPAGVELAGAAKNAAALASGATVGQGLNAAGAAAGHIFQEVWRLAEAHGARPEAMIGLAGTGDLVATALAPSSRNRMAGELLAQGVPAAEIPARIGQAVEALDSVPLLARALAEAGVEAPVTGGLAALVSGELELDGWVALVRTTIPPSGPARFGVRPGFWARLRARLASLFRRP
ncbi:MAG: NAD(P)H-dependent glycerol-3-phosphate dehydrogenase [Solirubrobacterales bacterium]